MLDARLLTITLQQILFGALSGLGKGILSSELYTLVKWLQ